MRGSCVFGRDRGNTTTALGSQEWFMSATGGETETPRGVREGSVIVKVFVTN
jgi:hypothetical protein